jgi:long-subunit fatty acid transport protein
MFQDDSHSPVRIASAAYVCPTAHDTRAPRAVAVAMLVALLCARPVLVSASPLLVPAIGAPDSALLGTEVAEPPTPEGAMFQNPAGLVAFQTTTYSAGLGAAFGKGRVEASVPPGYDETDRGIPLVPSVGVSLPLGDRARLGLGVFGSTGCTFDFDSQPPLIPYGFFSETAVAAAPVVLAYRLREEVWLGIEVSPLFGYLRNRFPLPDPVAGALTQVKYTVRGPGIQGMVGATWLPSKLVSLGLGVRTPGAVWLDGSTSYAGTRHDTNLVLQMPTQVFAGATLHATRRVDVSMALRWTDASRFGHSDIEFAGAGLPYIPDAQDEWRTGMGTTFRATDDITLRGSVSYATSIVGTKGASPLVFDSDDLSLSAGISYRLGLWTLHATGGYQFEGERKVSADEAFIMPGRYTNSGGMVLFGAMYRL